MIILLAYLVGVVTAWAFAKYMIAVTQRRPVQAAAWDFMIMFLAQVLILTLWAKTGDSIWVLIGYIFGNSTGTYFVTKYTKKDPI